MIIFSLIGIIDAGYVSYNLLNGLLPVCQPGFECAKVLESPWLNVGPVSISYVGFFFFIIFLIASSLHLLEIRQIEQVKKWLHYQSIIGLLFAIYVISLMAFVIQGWCLYCLISGTTALIMFGLTQILLRIDRPAQKEIQPE